MSTRALIGTSAVAAALYPWLLEGFHWAVTTPSAEVPLSGSAVALAALLLIAAFLVPLTALLLASAPATEVRARRFALLTVAAPTLYVFFGVLTYMAGVSLPDPWLWTPAWLLLGLLAARRPESTSRPSRPSSAGLRVAHGIAGVIALLYVLFHLFNHLAGLLGPEVHKYVMDIGRQVYRAKAIEPLLVLVMLFQIGSGLRLAWTWSERTVDRYRVFQVASGVFMAVFILGHMNSVFIFARTFLGIPTDWAFAAGLPTGLIHDPWNIRLLPHYALGVFFVLAHLFSGLRVVLLAHGTGVSSANRIWWSGAVLSALVSLAIMLGMCGWRVG